ncbi:ribonuclease H family protein [Intrasporangium flavum]|uniref:ribonuclease H family protein n=1 Tax=Intrasporangium flavum TaxID=1428657 RepID=UPI001F603D88|nr:ribonuclease H [Intrasporangium flavum]
MLAKFPGRCTQCQGPIRPGEEIVGAGGGSTAWVHAACGDDLALPGLAAPRATPSRTPGATAADRSAGKGAGRARTPRAPKAPMSAPAGATYVYTDGACSGNPGPGGWAWAIDRDRFASGSERPSTNQRMEIRAALEAITALSGPLVVVSDSTYVVNCFRDRWWEGWLARGWTTSAKKPVANRDLWEPLVTAVRDRGDVAFQWVKGHSGHEMNDLVDELAVAASLARD